MFFSDCISTNCSFLTKQHQKEKMTQEIALHRSLSHHNIVKFHSNFSTELFVIITLELCSRRSLMELHKRRGKILEPECRYYISQVQTGVAYLHDRRIVHRDLKLGNVFLDEKLVCKIGDFGLAAQMDEDGTPRKTMCGTPNYLAPEILQKKGHNYQVDVWSLGCMLYTLIVGKPPFETSTLKETYSRIKNGQYTIPSHVSNDGAEVIKKMLADTPIDRPRIHELTCLSWFKLWTPESLPASALSTEPRFDEDELENQPPVNTAVQAALNNQRGGTGQSGVGRPLGNAAVAMAEQRHQRAMDSIKKIKDEQVKMKSNRRLSTIRHKKEHDVNCFTELLPNLITQLTNFVHRRPDRYQNINMDEAEKPELAPLFWITKWVDFQEKYGFGYALAEGHYGVNFRDDERTVQNANNINLMHVDKNGDEHHYNKDRKDYPRYSDPREERNFNKKIQLTDHFINYMRQHLLTAGPNKESSGDDFARIPYLQKWERINSEPQNVLPESHGLQVQKQQSSTNADCIGFLLTNGTFQCNFHSSHIKVILCPLMEAVTFLDFNNYSEKTYSIKTMEQHGCDREPFMYLRYVLNAAISFRQSHQARQSQLVHRQQRREAGK
jgi:polo-like kinase 1